MKSKDGKAGRRKTSNRRESPPDDSVARTTAAMKEAVREFRRCVRTCRRKDSPEAVHRLRVQARMLMVWCEMMEALAPGSRAPEARRKLKKLLRTLARLRDIQVQLNLLKSVPDRLAPAARLARRRWRGQKVRWIGRVRNRCQRIHPSRIQAAMLGRSGTGGSLSGAKRGGAWGDLETVIRRWLSGLELEARNRLKAVRRADPESLHRLRIAVKQLRYGVEAVDGWVLRVRAADLRRLRNLQASLGTIQDFETGRVRLATMDTEDATEAKELGELGCWFTAKRDAKIRSFFTAGRSRDPKAFGLCVVQECASGAR